jgi:predicted phosphodiesterase
LVIHGHQMRDVDRVAGYGREIDVICGHTHVAMAERGPRGRRWNPGSLGDPQLGDPATYGLYDDGVFRVLSVDGQLVCEDRLP